MARLALVAVLALLALSAPAAAAVQQPRVHYAAPVTGTDAFVAIVKKLNCFKAYLSDGTHDGSATLSVWFQGCLDPDGRTLSASRGGIVLQADVTRRTATGTVTLRDGRSFPFSARSGDRGGLVGKTVTWQGRRYRSGFVVLRDNQVRWRIMPIGHGLYGDPPVQPANPCTDTAAERELLRAQSGPMSRLSGRWETRLNLGRVRPTGAEYNRLQQARGALDERIWRIDQQQYDCG
jgi:hypothetical protein